MNRRAFILSLPLFAVAKKMLPIAPPAMLCVKIGPHTYPLPDDFMMPSDEVLQEMADLIEKHFKQELTKRMEADLKRMWEGDAIDIEGDHNLGDTLQIKGIQQTPNTNETT